MEFAVFIAFLIIVAGALAAGIDAIHIIRHPNKDNKQTFFTMIAEIVLVNLTILFILLFIWITAIF